MAPAAAREARKAGVPRGVGSCPRKGEGDQREERNQKFSPERGDLVQGCIRARVVVRVSVILCSGVVRVQDLVLHGPTIVSADMQVQAGGLNEQDAGETHHEERGTRMHIVNGTASVLARNGQRPERALVGECGDRAAKPPALRAGGWCARGRGLRPRGAVLGLPRGAAVPVPLEIDRTMLPADLLRQIEDGRIPPREHSLERLAPGRRYRPRSRVRKCGGIRGRATARPVSERTGGDAPRRQMG